MAGDNQPDFHLDGQREDVPLPVAIQGEMQYPRNIDARNIDARNYNAVYYHPPPPPVGDIYRCDIGFPF